MATKTSFQLSPLAIPPETILPINLNKTMSKSQMKRGPKHPVL